MRRTLLFSLFALLTMGAAHDAGAQHHGGARLGVTRSGHGFNRARAASRRGFGYGYLPYGSDTGYAADYQPLLFSDQPQQPVQLPAPPAASLPVHPEVTEYKWPAASVASSSSASSTTSESEPQFFSIVLKDGSTLSAATIFASDDGLHYVDPDERHRRISIGEVDRAATLKLNRARNLNLYLPAAE